MGLKGDKGAVVYGFYSFFDKLGNGVILYFIMVRSAFFIFNNLLRIHSYLNRRMIFSSGL